jgi:hypothetical protein
MRCPTCREPLHELEWRWRIPKKTDDKEWKNLEHKVSLQKVERSVARNKIKEEKISKIEGMMESTENQRDSDRRSRKLTELSKERNRIQKTYTEPGGSGNEMKHEFTVYDLNLTYKGSNVCGDLLKEILSRTAVLVDTNTPVVKLASTFQDVHFVMGRTLSNETENPAAAYLKKGKVDGLQNLFALETSESNGVPHYVIHRGCENWREIFREDPKPLSLLNEEEVEEFNSELKRASILTEVETKRLQGSDIIRKEILELKASNETPYVKSIELSIRAFALHLIEGPHRKKEARKVSDNHPNVLGDTILVQEALLLGIPIVSSDRDVTSIAGFAGVTVIKPEQVGTGQPM